MLRHKLGSSRSTWVLTVPMKLIIRRLVPRKGRAKGSLKGTIRTLASPRYVSTSDNSVVGTTTLPERLFFGPRFPKHLGTQYRSPLLRADISDHIGQWASISETRSEYVLSK